MTFPKTLKYTLKFLLFWLTPMTLFTYPFWIRFSATNSRWIVIAWCIILMYLISILLAISCLIRKKYYDSIAFFSPFIIIFVLRSLPGIAHTFVVLGFIACFYPLSSFQANCDLKPFLFQSHTYELGVCEESENTDIPGYFDSLGLIVYDSSHMINRKILNLSDALIWQGILNLSIPQTIGGHYTVESIFNNYFVVDLQRD